MPNLRLSKYHAYEGFHALPGRRSCEDPENLSSSRLEVSATVDIILAPNVPHPAYVITQC